MKRCIFIGICLLAVITVSAFTACSKDENKLVTGNREQLKSVTIHINDKTVNEGKEIIITDALYMNSIFDKLSSTKVTTKKESPQIEVKLKLFLTYSYAYDGTSGEQDVIFLDDAYNIYRYADRGYVVGNNHELNSLLYGLFKDTELDMISEEQKAPQSVTICEYEGTRVKSSILIDDTKSIELIISELKTIDTKAILYPSALSDFALDTEYELTLEYKDQDSIVIFTGSETEDTFYRYSKTFSSTGEEGYVFGKNNKLYEYLVSLFEEHQEAVSEVDLWETGTNYEVFNTGSIGKKEFHYRVFDEQNNTIDSGCTSIIEPNFYANADFLRLSLNYGTGAVEYKYYDISQGLVSEIYDSVLSDRFTDNGILLSRLTHEDDIVVVAVRDAFDKSVFYRTFKGRFPIKFSPSTQAEFISDEQIKITYLTGEDNDEITEVFSFR